MGNTFVTATPASNVQTSGNRVCKLNIVGTRESLWRGGGGGRVCCVSEVERRLARCYSLTDTRVDHC